MSATLRAGSLKLVSSGKGKQWASRSKRSSMTRDQSFSMSRFLRQRPMGECSFLTEWSKPQTEMRPAIRRWWCMFLCVRILSHRKWLLSEQVMVAFWEKYVNTTQWKLWTIVRLIELSVMLAKNSYLIWPKALQTQKWTQCMRTEQHGSKTTKILTTLWSSIALTPSAQLRLFSSKSFTKQWKDPFERAELFVLRENASGCTLT